MSTVTIYFKKKADAIADAHRMGYTELFDTGSAGDYAYGSRLYFKKPGSAVCRTFLGASHCEVSRLKGQWAVSVF